MKGLDVLLLYMIEKVQGERSLSGCYHLLTGRRSGQAIQDAAVFGLQGWYGAFTRLPLSGFQAAVDQLLAQNMVIEGNGRLWLTPKGREAIHTYNEQYQFESRAFLVPNPPVLTKDLRQFWGRLRLTVQASSFYLVDESGYDPIVNDFQVQQWVRRLWHAETDKQAFITALYRELESYFEQVADPLIPHFMLDRFSGYGEPGWTLEQLAEIYALPQAVAILFWHQVLLHMLTYILTHQPPVLYRFTQQLGQELPLTESAQQTYRLFQAGMTLEEIAQKRKLKSSTVEDHLVEISIHDPAFPWERFLSMEQFVLIQRACTDLQTKKAAVLKRNVGESVSFFQIRLALVKGERDGSA